MKKLSVFIAMLLLVSNVVGQTPITLTFQAIDSITHNALALDSVNVKNLTKDCDTTLYDAVSVLNLVASWPYGLEDPGSRYSENIVLMPNVPNPCQGSTMVSIYLRNAGELNLAVYNNQGKRLSEYRNLFENGWHLFDISTRESQQMFLKVFDDKTIKTIKITSTAPGNEAERIYYKGQTGQGSILKSVPDATGFIFYLGNQLQYTAYVEGYQATILSGSPVSSQTFTFAMAPTGFTCGSSIVINHVTGAVAPVNKTVTYGTVTNIPGEPSKCWITSNLGSDHQATAVNDATEASAGWYWQFNRKQGYKHDGTTLTPAWTITSINENSDWFIANDPCNIELGTIWRIPTYTEWNNIDSTGNWTSWKGWWGSAMKLHTAGYLYNTVGYLSGRGGSGNYWSSTQNEAPSGWRLGFGGYSIMWSGRKAEGMSIRCLRDF